MNLEESIDYIKKQRRVHKSLVHASNILTKLKSKVAEKKDAAEKLAVKYADYLYQQLEDITEWDDTAIIKRVELLNDYYAFYDTADCDYNKLFSSQGKLRPTILEEFLFLLFYHYIKSLKEEINDRNDVIGSGMAKAYTNLYFSPLDLKRFVDTPSIKVHVKDQDFSVYRKVAFQVQEAGMPQEEMKVPILAVEVKTYLDKTMLEGIVATAEKLKMGNPYSRSVVVTETYEVDLTVDPSYSQIDQIYVLRKCRVADENTPIYADVVQSFFKESIEHLQDTWSDVKTKLQSKGKII